MFFDILEFVVSVIPAQPGIQRRDSGFPPARK